MGDVGDPAAEVRGGDPAPHRLLGDADQLAHLVGYVADRDRRGGVAVPALDDRPAVDRHDVALFEHPVAGDAVHDLVVDRRAQGVPVARDALERRRRTAAEDVLLRQLVELDGGHPGPHGLRQELEGLPDHQTRPAHARDLVGGLGLDPGPAEHQEPWTPLSALSIRAVTSSTSPMPSTCTSSPRWP